ncbi:MAG: hypothetical protein V7607_2397 [Solirubrobacteraceae bacterium]
MGHDDLTRRLRAAMPASARIEESAFDADLLARVRTQPRVHTRSIRPRRSLPRAATAAALAAGTVATAAVVMLVGGPGHVAGPSSAQAIDQALHWFTPPAGTVLHESRVVAQGGVTTNYEIWQSADHPERVREIVSGAHPYELSGNAIYDPATDTIYSPDTKPAPPATGDGTASMGGGITVDGSAPASPSATKKTVPASSPATEQQEQKAATKNAGDPIIAGDPIVGKVRLLLQRGDMQVSGPQLHDGTDAWVIASKPNVGRSVWTLWVSASDGKPLGLRDPGDGAQVVRWTNYEVLPADRATQPLSLTAAHPTARVVRDPDQALAAQRRLGIAKH